MTDLSRILIYDEPAAPTLMIAEIVSYLKAYLPSFDVTVPGEFFAYWLAQQDDQDDRPTALARRIASIRTRNVAEPVVPLDPMPMEVRYEQKNISATDNRKIGVPYDGFQYAETCWELIPPAERRLDELHVIFTAQLLTSFDESDRRNHLRTIICAVPCLVSTTGLVEAPAKPREYYLRRQEFRILGQSGISAALEAELGDAVLHRDDVRLTEVAKGYVLQALAYHTLGEPFCDDPDCRLFNAHWQKDMLHAQLEGRFDICPRHEAWIEELNGTS